MIQEFIQSYGSLIIAIAAIAAVFLTDYLNKRRDRKFKEEEIEAQKQSVRMLICLEIDKNLQMLYELWDKIHKIDHEKNTDQILELAQNLEKINLPPWKDDFWKSQISILPIALNKDEILAVNDFYNNLDNIKSIYYGLKSLEKIDHEERIAVNNQSHDRTNEFRIFTGRISRSYAFLNESPDYWVEFEKITIKLIEDGNPICK